MGASLCPIVSLSAKTANPLSLKKTQKILYIGGCRGVTVSGKKAGFLAHTNVRKLINGFDVKKYDITLKSANVLVASADSVNDCIYAEGIGEKLQPITLDLSGWYLAVVRPAIPVPTKEAFSLITPQHPEKTCLNIVMQPVDTWRDELTNDFERSVFTLHPEIGAIKDRLYDMGATYAAMSGSGSSLFGLFREPVSLDDFNDEGTFKTIIPLT